ncbi:MAG TPA: C45 family peptidase [Gemmataceae bacterium]|nr:C45 family peptidase [Gemmataceae bacterium]
MRFRPTLASGFLFLLCLFPATTMAEEPFRFTEAKHGKGTLKYINDLPVLIVEGTPEEIGEQVGILAVKPAPRILNIFHEFLALRGLEKTWPWLVKVSNLMAAQFPPDHLKEMEAAAKASGFDRDTVIVLHTVYDIAKLSGCSTLYAEPSRSATGSLLLGHNLDFYAIANVHEYSLVIICRPQGKHAFASVGFPGLFGCLSAINDAGLCLVTNEVTSTSDGSPKFDLAGVPLILAFRRIMEECTTVDEAEKLIRSIRRTSTINLTVCDKKEGKIFEITPKNVKARPAEKGLGMCTNHFRTKELATNTSCWRYDVLLKIQDLKTVGRPEIAKKLDEANQREGTIQTMIFEPATLRLDLAIGKGPTSTMPMKTLELSALLRKN